MPYSHKSWQDKRIAAINRKISREPQAAPSTLVIVIVSNISLSHFIRTKYCLSPSHTLPQGVETATKRPSRKKNDKKNSFSRRTRRLLPSSMP